MSVNILLANILDSDDNLSESSDENSDLEDTVIEILCSVVSSKFTGTPRTTVKNYVENVVLNYSDKQFISHSRAKKALYLSLSTEFNESAVYQNLSKNARSRQNISSDKHILTFLWFAGHQTASFRDVADRFDLSLSSLFDVVTRVMRFLNSKVHDVIKLPTDQEKLNTKMYYNAKGFPNVIGAIDGSHIRIDRPRERPTDYFNRKEYHSVVLQGVCNANLKFIDIFVGYPGSVHDARVFRNSPLYNHLESFCKDDYILGDSAYPLLPNIITPYRDNGHLNATQKKCNKMHSSCRVSIEHAFGRLKQRFRQLYHVKLVGPQRICEFITACCVLHNLCQDDGVTFDDEYKADDVQPTTMPCTDENKKRGVLIRDSLCELLFVNK